MSSKKSKKHILFFLSAAITLCAFPLPSSASLFHKSTKAERVLQDGMYNIHLADDSGGMPYAGGEEQKETEAEKEKQEAGEKATSSPQTEFPISRSESATYIVGGGGELLAEESTKTMSGNAQEKDTEKDTEKEKSVLDNSVSSSLSSFPFVLDMQSCTLQDLQNHVIQVFHQEGARQQQFFLKKTKGGFYITNTSAGQENSFLSEEEGKIALKKEGGDSSVWKIKQDGEYFNIVSPSGKYLTGEPYDTAEVALEEKKEDEEGKKKQRWIFEHIKISEDDKLTDSDSANPYDKRYGKFRGKDVSLTITNDKTGETEVISKDEIAQIFDSAGTHNEEGRKEGLKELMKKKGAGWENLPSSFSFLTHDGASIPAPDAGLENKIGWEEMAEKAEEKAEKGESGNIDVSWDTYYGTLNDIGDYVEIDLSNQHVFVYIGGNLIVDSPCVSGLAGTSRETPAGIYHIYYKQSPAVLKGQGYSSPVSFWMPFCGGIGLHDAPWRSSFGGDIYKYDGSHGCINLPYDAAKTLYENAYEGMTVICHW